ncbi:hypothetical protein MMC25_001362 [Agyrium rufum]|nr:hypothetical protein [Agyrium rufum]
MSKEYEGQDPLVLAHQAERELNSNAAKSGNVSDSISGDDSGINEAAAQKYPGGSVITGSAASGAGDNREIPVEEGGSINKLGRATKARDFEGEGGPEEKQHKYEQENPGNDDVRGNIRQGGETIRPGGS